MEARGREVEQSDIDDKDAERNTKDADVVVVDASVLVHGIEHLKRWCRNGREEIVIVPLEGVFNPLSSSHLAQIGIQC